MSQQPVSVLIVDDDPNFRMGLRASLKTGGYATDTARTAQEALERVRERPIDIVLLDINMPGLSGVEACRRIRAATPKTGILMLTVRDSEEDKIQALEAGADDYVTKPFRFGELIARLRSVLRRTGGGAPQDSVARIGDLEIGWEHRTLRKSGKEVHLSPKEFELLALLMQHLDVPVAHAKILRTIWGPEYSDEPGYLRSYVKMLRKKIEDDPTRPQYLLTEPWVGYRFRDPSSAPAPPARFDSAENDE